ncbi:hypothetical protein [Sphingobium sp. B2]|uniref:hypothetical protein n=1 Tax=Sphingobium sp. B2 TaxID=2583228 RepID=UPI0011A7F194|nr:hypothetical protein [Sphingobium sp. B2]
MSRDQKPGKVRMVAGTPERRRPDDGAQASQGAPDQAGATPVEGTEQQQARGISLIVIALCLGCGFVGGAAIVALAPMLGLV